MKKIYRIALALLFAATGLNAQSSEKTVIINTNVGIRKARLYDDVPNHVRTFIARRPDKASSTGHFYPCDQRVYDPGEERPTQRMHRPEPVAVLVIRRRRSCRS